MLFILDCDIASTFAKIDRVDLLEKVFPKSSFHITNSVYAELMRSRRAGFSFPDRIFSKFTLTSLRDKELEIFQEISMDERIHFGEAEGISVCKKRDAVFLTNDQVVVKFCEENGIKVLDLKDILLHMAEKRVLGRDEMTQIIKEIEAKDNTTIKDVGGYTESVRGLACEVKKSYEWEYYYDFISNHSFNRLCKSYF